MAQRRWRLWLASGPSRDRVAAARLDRLQDVHQAIVRAQASWPDTDELQHLTALSTQVQVRIGQLKETPT